MAQKLTTCTFCGVGCGLYLETAGGRIVGAYPSMSHPTNRGRICLRGWHVHEVAGSPDRLLRPLIRGSSGFREVSWDEAVSFISERLRDIIERHGPDATAFLNSPRCSNEEAYLLQKLARSVVGTNNVDHGTGVYVHNSIDALQDMLGIPATTNPVGDLALSDLILVDGVDLARQTPTVGGVVMRAKLAGARLIVVDPRRHRLAEHADIHLRVRPGTETVLYGAMAKVIVDRGLTASGFVKAHCDGVHACLEAIARYDLLSAAEACDVAAADIETAAVAFAEASAASLVYSTGVEARQSDTISAAVNLALLTGQIGRPGAGIYALTEQNNLQGVCDMGMLPDRLPGHQRVTDPDAASRLARIWGWGPPVRAGLSAREVLGGLGNGAIRALWLCRYDPASTAFFGDAAWALEQCELVVVQHLFMTETAKYADVVLPTTAFGEETVTFTSTDRRIQVAEKVIDGPGETEPAWRHIVRVAQAMGANWSNETPESVMDEIGRAVPFYEAASYDNLRRDYGVPWPCTRQRPVGTPRLFDDESDQGKFRLLPVARPALRPHADQFPITLVFGNSHYYWHQNVLIRHSETLKREHRILLLDYPEGFVEINEEDARRLSVRDGETIRLCARAGCVNVAARVTSEVRPGAAYVPFFVKSVQQEIHGNHEMASPYVDVRIEKASS